MVYEKDDSTIRLLCLNVNGLGTTKGKAKNSLLQQFLLKYEFTIMALQETNVNWTQLHTSDSWNERTIGWWEGGHRTVHAYNEHDMVPQLTQPGGCLLAATKKPKLLVIDQGKDFRGLGRWAWLRFRGHHQHTTRVILAYRCGYIAGENTVFSQQRRFFDFLKDGRHPRNIMVDDLLSEITKWQEEGDRIILMIDANEHVVTGNIATRLQEVGLHEGILRRHQDKEGLAPTHQKGSFPIDGIFVSENIAVKAGGYLAF